ncbi:MAG: hypothetical protein ACHQT7_00115 [Candidatus Levyibacteriota bacterium]
MCKCDGISFDTTSFVAGQTLAVTAYSKVEGTDTSYATVPYMLFTSAHDSSPNNEIRDIPYNIKIATTIVEQSATKVRYKAVWSYTVPANPDPKLLYKVRSVPECVQKTAGIQSVSRVAEAATPVTVSTGKNIFSQLIDFILGIFGKKPASTTSRIQSGPGDTLQLDTLRMGEITGTDYCSYIEFRVK